MFGLTGEINPEPITGVIPYVLSGEWTLLSTNNNVGPMCYCILNNFTLFSIFPDGPDDIWEIVSW